MTVPPALEISHDSASLDLRLVTVQTSNDGSTKYVWNSRDRFYVESISFSYFGSSHICVSSQGGCAVGCSFCETGRVRNAQNLSVDQIVQQVAASRDNETWDPREPMYSVVQFAGMGEPLLNLGNVAGATDEIIKRGLAAEVTLTTVGIVPRLSELAQTAVRRLSVSLHATDNATRSRLIPVNRKYPIEAVMAAATAYKHATDNQVTINYLLLDGINDGDDDLERLCKIVDHELFSIKLKAWNEISNTSLRRSPSAKFETFAKVLADRGFDVSICESMGTDVGGGCGQLSAAIRSRP
jgi:23S rRNA (adenine2503-C2)-methyltransferase